MSHASGWQATDHLRANRARDNRATHGAQLQRLHEPVHRFCKRLPRRPERDNCVRALSVSDDRCVRPVQVERVIRTSLDGFGCRSPGDRVQCAFVFASVSFVSCAELGRRAVIDRVHVCGRVLFPDTQRYGMAVDAS